jgi:hypothetical protein
MATGCVAGAQGGRRSLDCERGCNMLSSMLASATPMEGRYFRLGSSGYGNEGSGIWTHQAGSANRSR